MPNQSEIQTVAIAATFTAEPVAASINFWMQELGIPSRVAFASYNQVFQELLDPASLLSRNDNGVNVLLIRLADWLGSPGRSSSSRELKCNNAIEVQRTAGQFVEAVRQFVQRSAVPLLVVSCPNPDEAAVGTELLATLGGIEEQIINELKNSSEVHVVSAAQLMSLYPVAEYYDSYGDKSTHLPYTPACFASIGTMVSRRIFRLKSAPYKVIVLDCDQTLWKGVCAEDGPSGVEMDSPRTWLQESMVLHHDTGMILCLCSKNNPEDVFRVFESRSDMPLRREHITASRINWNSKSDNLRSLAEELQVGLNSFIFIDDSPVECAEVRRNCPDVLTLHLPSDGERIPRFLQHVWALDRIRITSEDSRRASFYRQNLERATAQETLGLRGFFATLNLTVRISKMHEDQLPRVAQLVERTNQFNLTTIRRTESELRKLWRSGTYDFLTCEVEDRYGDYGLVGLTISSRESRSIVVDTFLLSCRALGRGVEHQMLASLGQRALEQSLEFVDAPYLETQRNRPALDFLRSSGIGAPVSRGNELWFRFPSQHAATLTHPALDHSARPSIQGLDLGAPTEDTAAMPFEKPAVTSLRQSEQLSRIAEQFYDSTDILAAIVKWNRRERPKLGVALVLPDGPLQKELAQIWSEVLGIDTIALDDNFFDLGGHSLAAVQITFKIRRNFGVDFPLQALLQAPALRAQAQRLEEELLAQADAIELEKVVTDRLSALSPEQRAQAALQLLRARRKQPFAEFEPLPEIHPDPQNRYDQFPLSDIQEAYLIGRSDNVELGNISCQTYSEVDVSDWDHERLESALQAMIERHEMLRCIVLPDGRQQILKDAPRYRVQLMDLSGLEPAAAAAQLEALRRQLSQQARPTDRWPLFDFRVSRLDSRRSRLHVSFDLLIADARSFELFFGELAHLYHNPDAILPPLDVSFRDYLLAFNSFERTELYRESREYWLKRLPTLPPAPELPLATNTPSITRPEFKRRHVRMDAAIWQSLKERSARLSLTPAGILLAAYADVLAIWSKNPRFTINLTLFNRLPLHKQVNDIIGDFTSVTLLEVDNSGSKAFEGCAKRLQEQLWQDLDHRYFSGVRVMRELTRSQRVGPRAIMPVVFTSLLNLGDGNEGTLGAGRLGQTVYGISQTPQLYLDCIVHEEGQELVINWDAVDEVFPPGLLDDMFQSYRSLLAHLASDASSWHCSLAETERALIPATQMRLREEINDTETPISDELLHTLFLKQVEERPHQTAVCTPHRRLTYADVYRRACAIEELLVRRDVRPNQLVAVIMEKGWEQIVGVLGILFAGGAYLPINPELPAERQRYLIERGEVKVVLTQSAMQSRLSIPTGVEVLAVDLLKSADPGAPVPRRRQKPEDLAYVIFTSGSTGLPKGVMIDHRGAVNTVLDINQRFGIGCQDRALALSRLSFDLSVYDIFGLLAAGGTIVLPSFDLALDAAHWAHLIESEKVTVWNTVPTLMQLLVEEAERGAVIGQSLRLIMMSGDWIPTNLSGRIRSLLPQAKIVSLGGATEASIWSILYPIEQIDPNWTSIPYGKPMLNQSFHVLTETLAPRPVWVPGQLYIGGIGVAKGYWRDEEKTSASFIQDPATGQRLYRTGDLGRYLPDGNIEFLGREDFQIKLRGYRIELGEIEAAIKAHAGVREAVVVVREDVPGDRRLVGYCVARERQGPDLRELRAFLKRGLPEYMVPAALVFLDTLPLTSNGKVDRRALPAPDQPDGAHAPGFLAPRDDLETRLTKIWEEILGVRNIGIQHNLFEVGAHSLLVARLLTRIEREFGKKLTFASVFGAPTIEQLAALLRDSSAPTRFTQVFPIQPAGSKPPLFCIRAGFPFRPLSEYLGTEQPILGLHFDPSVVEQLHVPYTVEELAGYMVQAIREQQPQGPYFLGGFCNNGLIAYETARQLLQQGHEVALLAMFDTRSPAYFRHISNGHRRGVLRKWRRIPYHLQKLRQLKRADAYRYIGQRLEELWQTVRRAAWELSTEVCARRSAGRLTDFERIFFLALKNYNPEPYPGRVALFRADTKSDEALSGWRDVITGPVQAHVVPGTHLGMLADPSVQHLASRLAACIDEASELVTCGNPHSDRSAESALPGESSKTATRSANGDPSSAFLLNAELAQKGNSAGD
ncbi:MAG: amino acid adenylation domain-containing protein [Candidatus Acidiferrales bacterium]